MLRGTVLLGTAAILLAFVPRLSVGAVLFAADFAPYPTYQGDLAVTGAVTIRSLESDNGTKQVLSFDLAGADPACGSANTTGVANACGIHIHTGRNCSDSSTVGGHLWNSTASSTDPWEQVMYVTVGGQASSAGMDILTGETDEDLVGRAFVVHDVTGARVACSLIAPVGSQTLEARSFTRYPGYHGSLEVTGRVHLAQTDAGGTGQLMSYELTGVDLACMPVPQGVSNACGVHVHLGASCSDAGGHFWNRENRTEDPWRAVAYAASGSRAVGSGVAVQSGLTNGEIADRVVVVHDATGARVACSPVSVLAAGVAAPIAAPGPATTPAPSTTPAANDTARVTIIGGARAAGPASAVAVAVLGVALLL